MSEEQTSLPRSSDGTGARCGSDSRRTWPGQAPGGELPDGAGAERHADYPYDILTVQDILAMHAI